MLYSQFSRSRLSSQLPSVGTIPPRTLFLVPGGVEVCLNITVLAGQRGAFIVPAANQARYYGLCSAVGQAHSVPQYW